MRLGSVLTLVALPQLLHAAASAKDHLDHPIHDGTSSKTTPTSKLAPLKAPNPFLQSRIQEYKVKVTEMYYTALEGYLEFAYPKDELQPLTCSGINTIGNFSLTLIDALDTAMIMDDVSTFSRMVDLVRFVNFDQDVNVSVFETNIRVVGGLLSAHIMAKRHPSYSLEYDGILLTMAEKIGRKLLLAFNTPTGIPYGTVNMLSGVQKDESTVVCTACAGTFNIEFTWLSHLTGDPVFEQTARKAVRALWDRRSKIELFGNHIDVIDGRWIYPECSIGGGVDSFFEYLFKAHIAFSDEVEYGIMFKEIYRAIKLYMHKLDFYHMDVHFETGETISSQQWSLGAFWPSIKILSGDIIEAVHDMYPTALYLSKSPFLPEIMLPNSNTLQKGRAGYPLRPEFIESLWYLYRTTQDQNLLDLAFNFVDRLNMLTRTKCGFSNIANVETLKKENCMESFFLAETLKYLYLLFDQDNEYNVGNYVFNTEAHPFPVYSTYRTAMHPPQHVPEELLKYVSAEPLPNASKSYLGDTKDSGMVGLNLGVCPVGNWQWGQRLLAGFG
ncbi:hypothetical protein BASA61_007485 [Batrachochytrium salamandrivorans]|nr:hypothetical protein BASA61_007485 [Batrachochytrium salamandrivorans]